MILFVHTFVIYEEASILTNLPFSINQISWRQFGWNSCGLIHKEKSCHTITLRHKRVNCNRVKTDVLKVYVLEFLLGMYYIYIYTILLLAKLLFVRKTNETFGEDAMFVYLVRNYPWRNRVKYPLFRENIPLGLSTDKFSLYYT